MEQWKKVTGGKRAKGKKVRCNQAETSERKNRRFTDRLLGTSSLGGLL
jgi:hypothetical protein